LLTIEQDVVDSAIDGFRLSPQQRRMWSLIQQDGGSAYRSQCLVVIDGDLTLETLRQAVRQVVNGHEILHTTFQSLAGMTFPVQVVGDADAFAWRTVDFSAVSRERQDSELDAIYEAERRAALDISAGPLLRVVGIALGPGRHALLIVCSSLCADTASLPALVAAIARCLDTAVG